VIDPACGAADLLIAADALSAHADGEGQLTLCGIDISNAAVQISMANVEQRQRANIFAGDSLGLLTELEGRHDVVLCNPPFASWMRERRKDVLSSFELGAQADGVSKLTLGLQEVGLLFVELCLRSLVPGGRGVVVVPNGYLGNRSVRYVVFRRWLLLHARIAAIVGLPRFAFHHSGADVSASLVVFERRAHPLADLAQTQRQPFFCALAERVGWRLQGRRGSEILGPPPEGRVARPSGGAPAPESDFEGLLEQLLMSDVPEHFSWMQAGAAHKNLNVSVRELADPKTELASDASAGSGEQIPTVRDVIERRDLSCDPKLWSAKHLSVRRAVRSVSHLELSSVIRPVPYRLLRKKDASGVYRYVAIEDMHEAVGAYEWKECLPHELPSRALLVAAVGDIFIANIWSSAGKWMLAGSDANDGRLIVTSGCAHFELIPGSEDLLGDLMFGLCSEAFKVQMRALATGSDGLSTISVEDLQSIAVPRPQSVGVRAEFDRRIAELRKGQMVLPFLVREELAAVAPVADIRPRHSHVGQV
jgi:type I restriction enzyme M protein